MMRVFVVVLLFLAACENPTGKAALPNAKTPKEVALSFVDLLRRNHCDTALAYVNGNLKATYQKMIERKGFMFACEAWRAQYLPYSGVEFSHEEVITQSRKKVWLRLYKDDAGVFDVFSIEVESKGGRWWVVSV